MRPASLARRPARNETGMQAAHRNPAVLQKSLGNGIVAAARSSRRPVTALPAAACNHGAGRDNKGPAPPAGK